MNTFLTKFFDFDEFEKQMLSAYDGVTKALKPFLPYNMYKDEKGNLVYEIAVAGFSKDQLKIIATEEYVRIETAIAEQKQEYLYKGISSKSFQFTIPVSPLYNIEKASLENGLLKLVFVRNQKAASREIPIN